MCNNAVFTKLYEETRYGHRDTAAMENTPVVKITLEKWQSMLTESNDHFLTTTFVRVDDDNSFTDYEVESVYGKTDSEMIRETIQKFDALCHNHPDAIISKS